MRNLTFLNSIRFVAPLAIILGTSVLVAYAGPWVDPSQNPPLQSIGSPITPLDTTQIKSGILDLNTVNSPRALIVEGDPAGVPATGRVVIGPVGSVAEEQLSLFGNLNISGLIKPNGNSGNSNGALPQTLTRNTSGIDWENQGWMTVVGDWSPDTICSGASPNLCAVYGYKEYTHYCLIDLIQGYSVWIRVCRE
jgi:hypothetical protein